jgi:translation elongation factor EF-1alpha
VCQVVDGGASGSDASSSPLLDDVTRQHVTLLSALGVQPLLVCVNKMETNSARFAQKRTANIMAQVGCVLLLFSSTYR